MHCSGDAGFRPWAQWSPCSATCGEKSIKRRQRICIGECEGETLDKQKCDVLPCPGLFYSLFTFIKIVVIQSLSFPEVFSPSTC